MVTRNVKEYINNKTGTFLFSDSVSYWLDLLRRDVLEFSSLYFFMVLSCSNPIRKVEIKAKTPIIATMIIKRVYKTTPPLHPLVKSS